jgi:transmembrane sensor
MAYHEIQATYGTQSKLKLPDGTTVHLNSGSSMKYPVSFNNLDERRVELIGEGFFEVESQQGKPFIVDVGRLQVEVTGTRFNIDAYSDNSNITVALVEGSVNLTRGSASGSNPVAKLNPGEVAQFRTDENRLYINEVADMEKFYAWTEGKMVFIDDPIHVVVEKLSHWYNVDIEIADRRLDRYRFTGTFIDEPVEQILAILSRTSPMGYSIAPSRKLEDNSFTKRKIILKSK